ncbi:hypothetical protein G7Y89_g5029 [Cudoniella acicularis]|uniref:Uncharacterized protein n=1 Tax=Cudoniella acicularis TaxID=354080 RepID=A0A8H4RN90_9HELO|nr:hypothetical protein G7Y89_g5029 [Cudoniella acicularis]
MPPSISKSSIGALIRFRCLNAPIQPRSFSTTTSLSSIGPENPRFIEIPAAVQPQVLPKRDIKGVLPPPRNLFPKRAGDKTSHEYFVATIPGPKKKRKASNEYVAWKREMAETRRRNLREGLHALKSRKLRADHLVARKSLEKSQERERRVQAPPREDERLTSSTITNSMRELQLGPAPDPLREQRVAEKTARVQAKEAAREEARRSALHTLYMNARSFITTEEQLDATIEEIFVERPFKDIKNVANPNSNNIWEAMGQPPTVQNMLQNVNNNSRGTLMTYHLGPAQLTGQRMKKIGEELTGGKMDK